MPEILPLIVPSFIAGILTFLAPCTLPLVPGFLGFISGVSAKELSKQEQIPNIRKRIVLNGSMYVLGFSFVFVLLGSLFGLAGGALIQHRVWLGKIGGLFVIFFGLYLLGLFDSTFLRFLKTTKQLPFVHYLKPGKPGSSLIFGMTFAFGWTPCVGPILGTVLLLASTSGTVLSGAVLLSIFSLGLGIPFMVLALGIGKAVEYIHKFSKHLQVISIIGGVFLVLIGLLLVFDQFDWFIRLFYTLFEFLNYEQLLMRGL